MAVYRRGDVWWYEFIFAGKRVRESAKTSSKTVAKAAEQVRRRELEKRFRDCQSSGERIAFYQWRMPLVRTPKGTRQTIDPKPLFGRAAVWLM